MFAMKLSFQLFGSSDQSNTYLPVSNINLRHKIFKKKGFSNIKSGALF